MNKHDYYYYYHYYYDQDGDKLIAYHEAQLLRLSANFAFSADLALLLGGRLKFEELLMGRLADAMGAIFLGHAEMHPRSRAEMRPRSRADPRALACTYVALAELTQVLDTAPFRT